MHAKQFILAENTIRQFKYNCTIWYWLKESMHYIYLFRIKE